MLADVLLCRALSAAEPGGICIATGGAISPAQVNASSVTAQVFSRMSANGLTVTDGPTLTNVSNTDNR